jgi:hypothetical protein
MPYSYMPHAGTDIEPVAPVSERDLVTEENQGLDYIMPLDTGIRNPISW